MLDVALKLLKEITSHNYQAYIVGGFVRDYLLGIESNDIDITTNATPKQIKEIFHDSFLPNEDYGSVTVIMRGIRFEITTFRKEIDYVGNRWPSMVQYIDNLYDDLTRRDFTINTLCMDENGEILDYLGGREDLNHRIIRTVGNSNDRFQEDSLRILRAVRFATILDFKLDEEVKSAINKTKQFLKNLSYNRKREELDKIFTSINYKNGIKLLLEFGLDKELELFNLSKVLDTKVISLIGIWTVLDVEDKYPFQKNEIDLINKVKVALKVNNLDPVNLYQYGLYVNCVAAEIKNLDIKDVAIHYENLVIKTRSDIDITSQDIISILDRKPGKYIKDIYRDLEENILYGRLINNRKDICNYIINKYKEG